MTSSFKNALRNVVPSPIFREYHNLKRSLKQQQNRQKTTAEVFSEIYSSAEWGASDDEFGSGSGSADARFIQPYCDAIEMHLQHLGHDVTLIDLGCGDFRVAQTLLDQCESKVSHYIGIDIVPKLIQHHQMHNSSDDRHFVCINIIDDELPHGDVCCIRQVLQHLSNHQISQILNKVSQYKTVFITEHYPTDNPGIVPNIDKPHGGDIRLFDNSGVYLGQSPFEIPNASIELVLEVVGHGFGENSDPGVIRTYKISFSQ
jgi:hypothetical protein